MNFTFLHLLKCIVLFGVLMLGHQKCKCQTDSQDCRILALQYDHTLGVRQALASGKKYKRLDSLYSAQLILFDNHCPCAMKTGDITWRTANLKYILGEKNLAFDILNNRINRCREKNDSTTLFIFGRLAILNLWNDDYFNMKRNLDAAISIGEKSFQSGYKDLFIARVNLGLYYIWKRDYITALNIHILNEKDIENTIFKDTFAHINNLEHIKDIALILDDQNIVDTYSDKLLRLVKGSKFEKDVYNKNNEALLDYFIKKGDYLKAKYYFDKVDTMAYNDYFRAMPLIRYLGIIGQNKEAIKRLDHLDTLLARNIVAKHHFLRVNVTLERLKVMEIDQDVVINLSASIHNNYVNLINDSPSEQYDNINAIRDKYTAVIHRLIERDHKEYIPLIYDRLHNIKNASSSYYPKLLKLMAQSKDGDLKDNFNSYRRLCSLLKSGGRTDSLDMFASKIQNRLYDLGIKWHNNTTLSEVQGRLSDSEVFLDFYQTEKINGKEAIYLFVVTKDRIDFIHYKNVLDTLSMQLHSSNYVNNSKKNKALYNYLLQPLEPYVVGKNRIYLSPDGILNQIALDILSPVGSKDQIFGDQFELRYIENSKSLFENHLPTDAKDSYLITGGIQYDCTSPQDLLSATYKKSDFERSKTQYLEGSKREVDLIMSKLMDKNITFKNFSGCSAIKDSISLTLEDRDISHVHISTHGVIDTTFTRNIDKYFASNSQSQLLLTKINKQDDAGLSAIEIINQNHTDKKLVFLSACNTGIGTYMAGFGNASVANAFKKAGSSQVVASLWPIPDDVTVLLCDYFYDHYLTHQDANAALKFAQNELRKQNLPPEKWAAFRVLN